VDLLRCESLTLRSHWVLLVMDQYTRRIIGFGVHAGTLDGIALCRMLNAVIRGQTLPRYRSSDRDPLFRFHRWRANLRVLDVEEIKTVPYVPLSHPFVERLIGTLRREYLDQVPFWGAAELRRKLAAFQDFYNTHRTHAGLGAETPFQRAGAPTASPISIERFAWQPHCRGLFHTPVTVSIRNSPGTCFRIAADLPEKVDFVTPDPASMSRSFLVLVNTDDQGSTGRRQRGILARG